MVRPHTQWSEAIDSEKEIGFTNTIDPLSLVNILKIYNESFNKLIQLL